MGYQAALAQTEKLIAAVTATPPSNSHQHGRCRTVLVAARFS
jgi:hypothetical protein